MPREAGGGSLSPRPELFVEGRGDRTSPLTTPDELIAAGLLPSTAAEAAARVAERYAVRLTPDVAALIDRTDPADPIARQFLPDARELDVAPEERADPIGDGAFAPVKGIVHRYPDRVLLKPLQACPVYCRFCFRREVVGPNGEALSPAELAAALDYVRSRAQVWEVIVTGGDPFLLSPRRLAEIVAALDAIGHVGVARFHTRVPVADPGRVTPELIHALRARRLPVYVAVHCNHPRELTDAARGALRRLTEAGIALLGQSVLLRGVNDDAATLEALMRALVEARVRPYYLHHPDLAPGTAHFRLSIAEGQALVRALRGRLSGIAQPTYVLDIPGGAGKVPVGPGYLHDNPDAGLRVEDWQGRLHPYPPA